LQLPKNRQIKLAKKGPTLLLPLGRSLSATAAASATMAVPNMGTPGKNCGGMTVFCFSWCQKTKKHFSIRCSPHK